MCLFYQTQIFNSFQAITLHSRTLTLSSKTVKVHKSTTSNDLWDRTWGKIKYEEEMVSFSGALLQHWKRLCWIMDMWHQADKNHMILQPQGNGWNIIDQSTLEMDWDSQDHVENVRHRVTLLSKGCNCKTGCRTAHCGCVKRNGKCSAGCNCQNCCNLHTSTASDDLVDMAIVERSSTNHDECSPFW